MKSPVFSGKTPGGDTRVVAQYGKGKALVKDKHGKQMLLVSSQPLQTKNPQGMLAPVDLSFRKPLPGSGPSIARCRSSWTP